MAYGSGNFTTAQTGLTLVAAGAKHKIVLKRVSVYCHGANSVNTLAAIGFNASQQKVVASHPGIAAGSGFVEILDSLGEGLEGEPLTFTCGVPTGGSIQVNYTYDIYWIG